MAEKKREVLKGIGHLFETNNTMDVLQEIENNARNVPGLKEEEISVFSIRPNPYQPRKEFDEKALEELANSIRVHGIFTPLIVRKSVKDYELIAGERRLRAAKKAGLKTVPAIIVDFKDEQMMEVSLLENIQREDLNPIEEAIAFDNLVQKLGYTQEKLAERVGKSREYCANMLRLLKLPNNVQQMVVEKKLTMGHVRPLLSLNDEDEMYDAAQYILSQKMSVREVEEYIKILTNSKNVKKKHLNLKDPLIKDLENRLSTKLGTRVEIGAKKFSIAYNGINDLNRILELLGCIEDEA